MVGVKDFRNRIAVEVGDDGGNEIRLVAPGGIGRSGQAIAPQFGAFFIQNDQERAIDAVQSRHCAGVAGHAEQRDAEQNMRSRNSKRKDNAPPCARRRGGRFRSGGAGRRAPGLEFGGAGEDAAARAGLAMDRQSAFPLPMLHGSNSDSEMECNIFPGIEYFRAGPRRRRAVHWRSLVHLKEEYT